MLNFNLTREEFETLAHYYKTNDPEWMLNYKAFCHNINKAFTVYGIQKDPTAPVPAVTTAHTTLARRKYLYLSAY